MRVLQSQRRLANAFANPIDGQWTLVLDQIPQVVSRDVFHDQIMDFSVCARIVGGHNVRVIECGDCLDFVAKATDGLAVLHDPGREHFDGHDPTHLAVQRLEDGPHAAGPNAIQQPVLS